MDDDIIDHGVSPIYDISTRVTHGPAIETTVEKITGMTSREVQDGLVIEEPLEIQLLYGPADSRQTKSISVTMRTPSSDFELSAGVLMTEGVVHDANDIEQMAYASGQNNEIATVAVSSKQNAVRVELATDVPVSIANLQCSFYTTSSCGICGKASLLAL